MIRSDRSGGLGCGGDAAKCLLGLRVFVKYACVRVCKYILCMRVCVVVYACMYVLLSMHACVVVYV